MMVGMEREKQFIERARGLLDRSVENLDSRTKQRLEHIRMAALEAAGQNRQGFLFPNRWFTVGGFATATVAVAALLFWWQASTSDLPVKNIEDLEILSSHERIEFYQDLDFYQWLASQNPPTEKALSL